jgi:hypothetical protein
VQKIEAKKQPCVRSKLSYKRQAAQGEAQARQNARSDRVCLDFFFGSFICIKAKERTISIKKNQFLESGMSVQRNSVRRS